MSKYAPLTSYLASRRDPRIPMAFSEIEALIAARLPASARDHRPWWANSNHGHTQSRGWLDAGYRTEEVDLTAERLVFVRLNAVAATPAKADKRSGDHPLFGCQRGTMKVPQGVDLTEPGYSDAEMEALVDRKARLIGGGT